MTSEMLLSWPDDVLTYNLRECDRLNHNKVGAELLGIQHPKASCQ